MVLTAEEAVAVTFRQHSRRLRAAGHPPRRHPVPRQFSVLWHRLPLSADGRSPPKKKSPDYPLGCIPVDFVEVHTEEGRVYLFVAINRASRVAFAGRYPRATKMRTVGCCAWCWLSSLITNGCWLGSLTKCARRYLFDRVRPEHGIEHCSKPAHLWTNGRAERRNRTVGTAQRLHY